MATPRDTGDAVNLANFHQLKNLTGTFDPVYSPARTSLQRTELDGLYNTCSLAQKEAVDKGSIYHRLVTDRENAFSRLSKIITRALNYAGSSDMLPQNLHNLTTVANKIRGYKKRPSKKDNGTDQTSTGTENKDQETTEEEKKYSDSQMSFVMRVENLGKFISMLTLEPLYQPEAADITVAGLESLRVELDQFNTDIAAVFPVYKAALYTRNKLFYTPVTGMLDIAYAVKKYTLSEYGNGSLAHTSIKSIAFRRKEI